MVNKNSGVDAPFQQKTKCHSSKMLRAHCNYSNAVSGVLIWREVIKTFPIVLMVARDGKAFERSISRLQGFSIAFPKAECSDYYHRPCQGGK